ncbi:MAG: hypothetical protein ACE5IY_20790 [bacterium]
MKKFSLLYMTLWLAVLGCSSEEKTTALCPGETRNGRVNFVLPDDATNINVRVTNGDAPFVEVKITEINISGSFIDISYQIVVSASVEIGKTYRSLVIVLFNRPGSSSTLEDNAEIKVEIKDCTGTSVLAP